MHAIYKIPLLIYLAWLVSVILNASAQAEPFNVSTYQINDIVCTRTHDGDRITISCEPSAKEEAKDD